MIIDPAITKRGTIVLLINTIIHVVAHINRHISTVELQFHN